MSRATQDAATLRMASRTGLSPSAERLSRRFRSPCFLRYRGPTTPARPEPCGFGLFPVRSPLLGESFLFSLPAGTKMFQFPAFASSMRRMAGLQPAGLSHSEIRGSRVICTSPRLFAAYRVLRRLQEPRHPPCALSYFLPPHGTPQKRADVKRACRKKDFRLLMYFFAFIVLRFFTSRYVLGMYS